MPAHIWAFVALVDVDLIYLFSIPFFRRRAYNLFYCSHVVLFILFLPAVSPNCFHVILPAFDNSIYLASRSSTWCLALRHCRRRYHQSRPPHPTYENTRVQCTHTSDPRSHAHTYRGSPAQCWLEGRTTRTAPRDFLRHGMVRLGRESPIYHCYCCEDT
jgi:hypothetical protein